MTVLVGPKVYMLAVRRLASLCFGSIKIPQSQSRASGEAVMPRREVARWRCRRSSPSRSATPPATTC